MTPPTPQAIEAAKDIHFAVFDSGQFHIEEVAAVIDRAFAERLAAADLIAKRSKHYRETFIRCIGDPSVDHDMENADERLKDALAAYAKSKEAQP